MTVALGYRVYELTNNPLALGILGLVEAIPALSLALYGGHIADRHDRRRILRSTLGALIVCAIGLAILEFAGLNRAQLVLLYGLVFIAGIARGFAEPAAAALEAQVVPWELLINSSTLMASCWMTGAVVGPLAGGFALEHIGPAGTYLGIGGLYALAWLAITRMNPRQPASPSSNESVWESVATGVRYVVRDQVLLGSMALDLFAVFFGGAIALLPVFARDILHVDRVGLGILTAAPTAGSLLMLLWAHYRPPVRHAGRNLFVAVAGFGISMIVFAFSRSFYLSVIALAFSGACDGISVVIRRAIIRLLSPNALRGRIASVSMIFIGSSNELGAFESGLAAALIGPARSVWLGGVLTLVVVVVAAVMAPQLRQLSLDPRTVAKREEETDAELSA